MKKIDLHIHTVSTASDAKFDFSIDAFRRYVVESRLDAVAVTNHDVFDLDQYRNIAAALSIVVFPGIEINVEAGHLLVFADPSDAEDFSSKAAIVKSRVAADGRISVNEFKKIYTDLSRYLLIPHYEKSPPLSSDALEQLAPHLAAGEVDSAKKFVKCYKDMKKLTPVLFSDSRMRVGMSVFPIRQTFVDCEDITLGSLKLCLRERKVSLSERDGNKLWQAFPDGQQLSTGLNVLVGARSSGKTHTLDTLYASNENVKYIKQFELVQHGEVEDEKQFRGAIEKRSSTFSDQYLAGLKRVLEQMIDVDLVAGTRSVERYISSLLKAAEDIDREDAFSSAVLFNETDFPVTQTDTLVDLIRSVQQVIENLEYGEIVKKHIQRASLVALICELIEMLWNITLENSKKSYINALVKDVKMGLSIHTSATPVANVDLYDVLMDHKRVERFNDLVGQLKVERVIRDDPVQGFRNQVRRRSFSGAMEIRNAGHLKSAISEPFKRYGVPYEYLRELLKDDHIARGDLYKLFVKIEFKILNRDGFEVSGGERSEYRLLQEIQDAQNYDLLLIDEPESSFDNIFLRSDVNQVLKRIAEHLPVVVVTHNSTVGASVGADYILFTEKENTGSGVTYRVYAGYPSSRLLQCLDGEEIENHKVLMDSLEAGVEAYEGRRTIYEAVKNLG
ncbi:MAG: hypothetical protein KIS62_15080 [Ramlibacter sp.]|nr:hypothetical protein [Ramlibacter sp.]